MTKAITVTQPFASLIAAGVKRYETRSWSTKHRGPVLIHAGKSVWGPDAVRFGLELHHSGLLPSRLSGLPRGAIIAIAELVDVVPSEMVERDDLVSGPFLPAAFAWRLAAVRILPEFIPWRGRLGLWDGPDL